MTTIGSGNLIPLNDVQHSWIALDLAHAGSNNFTGNSIYDSDAC